MKPTTSERPVTSIAHAARPYTRLLDHVPDDVILDAAGREFDMGDANRCVVGWVLRGVVAKILDKTAEKVDLYKDDICESMGDADNWGYPISYSEAETIATFVGGKRDRWQELFYGVTHAPSSGHSVTLPVIEYAFTRRVAEAAERSQRARAR